MSDLRLAVVGAAGRMGRMLIACAARDPELHIAGEIDQGGDLKVVIGQGDVVIDFSSHNQPPAWRRSDRRRQSSRPGRRVHSKGCTAPRPSTA